jgi:hypothetical protein
VRLAHLSLFAAIVALSRRCVCVRRGVEARTISTFLVAMRVVVVREGRVRVGGLGPMGLARVAVVVYAGRHLGQRRDGRRCDGGVHAVIAIHGVVHGAVYGVVHVLLRFRDFVDVVDDVDWVVFFLGRCLEILVGHCLEILVGYCLGSLVGYRLGSLVGHCLRSLVGRCSRSLVGHCLGSLVGCCLRSLVRHCL